MALRYMGTKRALAPQVWALIRELTYPGDPVADLFAGMGAVSRLVARERPVVTNDALEFTAAFARARHLQVRRLPVAEIARMVYPNYQRAVRALELQWSFRIRRERRALEAGSVSLTRLLEQAPHPGVSRHYRSLASSASVADGLEGYQLATLYFSSGYFSTTHGVELDALRYSIDTLGEIQERDWLLSAWLTAAATVINSPGHTAQFLKPRTVEMHNRIRRQWSRSVWSLFLDALTELELCGTAANRRNSAVFVGDALDLIPKSQFDAVRLVYADPPYTKDHYSRYYHVYETLYRYDYPRIDGTGRCRVDRFSTAFSIQSKVRKAFETLIAEVAQREIPLVLSYPSNGLLSSAGVNVGDLLASAFRDIRTIVIDHEHSTLGASRGPSHKPAEEQIFVCTG